MEPDPPSHLRSTSEMRKPARSHYLLDTGTIHLVRISRQLLDIRPNASPQKLSRSVMFNDSGSDMFRVVNERKEMRDQLQAMENRIKSLQLAESKAKKKLEETKKIADEKVTLQLMKQRECEEKQQWRESIEQQRLSEKRKIERSRLERRQKLQQARELSLESKRVGYKQGKAQSLKQDSQLKMEEMRSFLDGEKARKERKRLEVSFGYRKMHSQFEAEERDQKVRVSTIFQTKKEAEKRMKQDMETRIRELEVLEQRIIENLKKTYTYHQDEVHRLETIVTRSRDHTRSPTSATVS